jgi:hypothetical protein
VTVSYIYYYATFLEYHSLRVAQPLQANNNYGVNAAWGGYIDQLLINKRYYAKSEASTTRVARLQAAFPATAAIDLINSCQLNHVTDHDYAIGL